MSLISRGGLAVLAGLLAGCGSLQESTKPSPNTSHIDYKVPTTYAVKKELGEELEAIGPASIDTANTTPEDLRNGSFKMDLEQYFQILPSQRRWSDVFSQSRDVVGIYAVDNWEHPAGKRLITLEREKEWRPKEFANTGLDEVVNRTYRGSAEDKMDHIFRRARNQDKQIAWNTGKEWFLSNAPENALWAHQAMEIYDTSGLPSLLASHLLIESGVDPLRKSSAALGISQISKYSFEVSQTYTSFVADWGDPGFELPLSSALIDSYTQLYGDELNGVSPFHSSHFNFLKFWNIGQRVVPDSVDDRTTVLAAGIRTSRKLRNTWGGRELLGSAGPRSMDYPGQVASLVPKLEELTDSTSAEPIHSYVTDRRWTVDELLEVTEMTKEELLRYNPHLRTDQEQGYRVMSPKVTLEYASIPENGRVNSPVIRDTLGTRDDIINKMEHSDALETFHETEFNPREEDIISRLDSTATALGEDGLWNYETALRTWIIPELEYFHGNDTFEHMDRLQQRFPRYLPDTNLYKSRSATSR